MVIAQKFLHGLLVSAFLLAVPVLVEPGILRETKVWVLVAVGVLATVFQPSYSATERARTPEDRWSAVQIVWSVFVVQEMALLDVVWGRHPDGLAWTSLSLIALALMLSGLLLRSWAVLTLGSYFTWNVEVRDDQRVVRSGPYALVRHPSYTGAVLTWFCSTVFLQSLWAALLALLLFPLAFGRRIVLEERLLSARLEGHDAYCKDVRAVIPWLL